MSRIIVCPTVTGNALRITLQEILLYPLMGPTEMLSRVEYRLFGKVFQYQLDMHEGFTPLIAFFYRRMLAWTCPS